MTYDEIKLPNPGILKAKLPDDLFEKIKADVMRAAEEKKAFDKALAGQIANEYTINVRPYFAEFINNMWIEYRERFDYYKYLPYNIPDTTWINFQRKHEYNPLHDHSGAAAWVLWLKIPYDLQQELNRFPNSNNKSTSLFYFYYNRYTGTQNIQSLPIDKYWEGTMIMFPAELKHSVHPFYTSDDVRISIAGNIDVYHEQ